MRTRLLWVPVVLCAAAAAAQAPRPQATVEAVKAKSASPPSAAEAKRRDQSLVSYKGGQITVGTLEDTIADQNPFMRRRYVEIAGKKELLEKTLRLSLLSDEAAHRGYGENDLVRQSVEQNAVQQFMKSELDDKLSADSVPKAEIEKYYAAHQDEYMQPAMQRASHVLLATEPEAKALIEQVKGMDLRAFRQLARDKSLDQATKLSGGDLRYFDAQGKVRAETASAVPLPIVKAAFALKTVGDTAPKPIKTDAGYSIVKLTGQRPAVSRKLSEAEETIRVRLWRERRQQAGEELVARLRAQYKPEIHPELLDAIVLEELDVGVHPPAPALTH
jgi:peptidyl-prolyl cis-trans isomerase C